MVFFNRSLASFEREFLAVMNGVAYFGSRSLFGQGYVKVVVEAVGLSFVALITVLLNDESEFLFEGGAVLVLGAARLVPLVSKISVARQAIANHSVAANFIIQTNNNDHDGWEECHILVKQNYFQISAHLARFQLESNVDKIIRYQSYWLRGDSGVGKSRLLDDLFHSIKKSGVHSVAYMPQQPSLLPFHINLLSADDNLESVLDRFGLSNLIGELRCLTDEDLRVQVSKLSAGEAQKDCIVIYHSWR